ncbi:hypothetical protein F2P56_014052 [Juglans regia]|uniref:UPF0496 protein At4g34320-like n=2 Tax=Juglans regia TaxID=51240 RepID=A0A2I4F491_JUGRE|nr:UPF0496 protein At4g34320-like [Juglans regia]XP_018826468.1 UPF0496 protein At4g34320-like [Juglans regia]KAF5463929.1 hypothetical protein F2P56_014052 [Juglans regia]
MVSNSSKTHFTADMNAYEVARELEVACELEVDIELGDSTGVEEPQLVCSDSIKEIVKCLNEMHLEVANCNLKCKEDIWNNQEFFSFLKDYFHCSLMAVDFCTALENCLKRTRDNQSIVQSAKTLQELRKFKDAEDPFTNEFSQLLRSVSEQHELMLDKLKPWKTKLDKKLDPVKTWRIVSNVIFVFAFVSVLVLTVVAAAIKAPAWATALTGALSVPMGSVGTWCNSLWGRYQSALKGKRGVISSMRDGTLTAKKDLGNIEALIRRLQIETDSMLEKADFALGEEEAVKLVLDEIQKKFGMFMKTAQNLSANADKCSGTSVSWRKLVLQSMFRRVCD